jgi:hypothetical protein
MNSRNWYRSPPQNEPQVSQPRPTYKSWVHHEPAMKAETTVAIQPFSLFNLVARWEWAINPTRWPLYHREWLDIICKMCCVGPRGGLDRCWKSHPPTWIRSPDRSESLYRLSYLSYLFSADKHRGVNLLPSTCSARSSVYWFLANRGNVHTMNAS